MTRKMPTVLRILSFGRDVQMRTKRRSHVQFSYGLSYYSDPSGDFVIQWALWHLIKLLKGPKGATQLAVEALVKAH
jgi:hypothetical protein